MGFVAPATLTLFVCHWNVAPPTWVTLNVADCPTSAVVLCGGVTGLLTGADVRAALVREQRGDRYLLPDVALSRGRFLDGTTAAHLPRVVEIVPTDGAALVRALRRPAT